MFEVIHYGDSSQRVGGGVLRQSMCWRSVSVLRHTHVLRDAIDAFSVFKLPYSFKIDENELKTNYRRLMNEYHPDKRPDNEAMAPLITRAYDCLRNKQSRATHLLEVIGYPLDETTSGDLVGTQFLVQIMELRETIDDEASDEELLLHLRNENEEIMRDEYEALDHAISMGAYEEAQVLVSRLQYWDRIKGSISSRLHNK